ncbi:DUF397 domain-containing protein [Actinomadura hibisca]|nr:DUF397 domain-containing protein [Actinomadura hibisca]
MAERVLIRDSRDPDGPRVAFGRDGFAALLRDVKGGVHDL